MRSSNSSMKGKDSVSFFRLGKYFQILRAASLASSHPMASFTDLTKGSTRVKSKPVDIPGSSVSEDDSGSTEGVGATEEKLGPALSVSGADVSRIVSRTDSLMRSVTSFASDSFSLVAC